MSTTALSEMENRLNRLERQNRVLILLLVAFAGIGSIAATNRPSRIAADEIRTAHLIIVDNHGKVLTETRGVDGKINISIRRTGILLLAARHVPKVHVGLCREAATQNSPGLQPWVRWLVKGALKVAPDFGRTSGITR